MPAPYIQYRNWVIVSSANVIVPDSVSPSPASPTITIKLDMPSFKFMIYYCFHWSVCFIQHGQRDKEISWDTASVTQNYYVCS